MKRTPMTRKTPLKTQALLSGKGSLAGPRKRIKPRSEKQEARIEEARAGRVAWAKRGEQPEPCAACGRVGFCHGHHAFPRQQVRKAGGDEFDQRNRIPLCAEHHMAHHANGQLPLSILTPENWAFARELLGDRAEEMLARHYRAV